MVEARKNRLLLLIGKPSKGEKTYSACSAQCDGMKPAQRRIYLNPQTLKEHRRLPKHQARRSTTTENWANSPLFISQVEAALGRCSFALESRNLAGLPPVMRFYRAAGRKRGHA